MKTALEAHNLTVSYSGKPVLWNVDFHIPTGKMVGILGPNGSGKTTLLKCAMHLLKSDGGFIKLLDSAFKEAINNIAYVPQRQSVDWDFPASVEEVVAMGLYKPKKLIQKIGSAEKLAIKEALKQLKIEDLAKRQIGELSGGQQQRVFIARALVRNADLFILDEPFVGIDAQTEAIILDLLRKKVIEGKTVICVHHDLKTAKEYFDWILFMNKHVVANGPIKEVYNDDNLDATYNRPYDILEAISDRVKQESFSIKSYKNKS
tara:strand:+ start:122187 stop:122972 length:786 start_codon:yes stop_codon:yes gene_type:complete